MFTTWQEIDSTSLSGTAKMIRKSIHRDLEDVSFGHGRREEFGISMDFFFRRPSEANAFSKALSELSFFLEWIMRWGKICWGTFHFWASRHIEADGTGWPADHLMQWVDPVDASLLPRNLEAELCDKASLSPAT